ncbi:hypothetical protein PR202_gb26297 [Eleusine coracana subsp. coracana]|uniref:Uncharacterized protein n=1 Tax=Eleusine coracana subsp. coracana TaxID=191504 RepID=A0AAV5FRH5_ELECO|nr:hypothetical protein PR202_gb26297 [Eleusine coracana subsp. coracana]
MPSACSISCTCVSGRPCMRGSTTSAGSRFWCRWSRTHCTTLRPSPNAGSTGRPARDGLQQHHPEAVHVALGRDLGHAPVLCA